MPLDDRTSHHILPIEREAVAAAGTDGTLMGFEHHIRSLEHHDQRILRAAQENGGLHDDVEHGLHIGWRLRENGRR